MVRAVERAFGRLDFAFNNAGVAPRAGPTADQTEEDFDRTVAINLKGVWLSMKYQIPPFSGPEAGPSSTMRRWAV